ncbi:MAG TPA: hypothetical protein PKV75_05925 [Desulfobacterales bacterium]|nr:hypothetical protein [Desulfobacterales bacterium]
MRIYDIKKTSNEKLSCLRPTVVVVTDIPGSELKIREYTDLVATWATKEFRIDPHRMLWIEYNPSKAEPLSPATRETYHAVDFSWSEGKATQPKRRPLRQPMLDTIKKLLADSG